MRLADCIKTHDPTIYSQKKLTSNKIIEVESKRIGKYMSILIKTKKEWLY